MKAVAFLAAAGAFALGAAHAQVAGATAAQPPAVADPNNPSPYGQMGSDQTVWAHLLVDQLEARVGSGGADLRWETQGWVGTDDWKLWVRDEGERTSEGRVQDGQLEAFVGKPISTYWNVLVGGRYDADSGPGRGWAALGIEGLAPRFFNVSATAYAGAKGLAGKLELSYDQLITNRLILEPEGELDVYSEDDPARRIGRGFSDVDAGLRLRYEVTRKFAPYIGVVWQQDFGRTADLNRAAGEDTRNVILFAVGVRSWF
jgi:copper resistance protein B